MTSQPSDDPTPSPPRYRGVCLRSASLSIALAFVLPVPNAGVTLVQRTGSAELTTSTKDPPPRSAARDPFDPLDVDLTDLLRQFNDELRPAPQT